MRQQQPGVFAGNAVVESRRHASVKAQGAYKLKNKKTIPKKLGAKRVGDQYVLPGTIIYKQRGTLWHPGENAILGRDHTIHAAVAGYVKYYRDPARHPERQYIGVTFERNDVLPYSPQAVRKRRLGLFAAPRKTAPALEPLTRSGIPWRVIRKETLIGVNAPRHAEESTNAEDPEVAAVEAAEAAADTPIPRKKESKATRAARRWNTYVRIKRANRVLYLGNNYSYRESNVQIGRLMGTHKGKTPGTQRYGSRHSMLRHRRKRRDEQLRQQRELERQQRTLDLVQKQTGGSPSGKRDRGGKKAAK